jgi:hypothetical protein
VVLAGAGMLRCSAVLKLGRGLDHAGKRAEVFGSGADSSQEGGSNYVNFLHHDQIL